MSKLVCDECGSSDVECKAWVNANTNEFTSPFESKDIIDNWCNVCEDHTTLSTEEE